MDINDVENIKIENKLVRLIGKEEVLKYKFDFVVSKKVDEIKE